MICIYEQIWKSVCFHKFPLETHELMTIYIILGFRNFVGKRKFVCRIFFLQRLKLEKLTNLPEDVLEAVSARPSHSRRDLKMKPSNPETAETEPENLGSANDES